MGTLYASHKQLSKLKSDVRIARCHDGQSNRVAFPITMLGALRLIALLVLKNFFTDVFANISHEEIRIVT